jgi:arginyl-tRNA synthetase
LVTRKFDRIIDVWGADHHGDLARVKGFVKALGYEKNFDILVHQFVRVVKDGKEVRMSKRTGNYILVDDLLKAVGRDVYRFFMLQYAPESHLTFDFELAKKQSKENPVYYLQYATARIAGILRKTEKMSDTSTHAIASNGEHLTYHDQFELALIKELIKFPDLISEISHSLEVHHLPHYGIALAKKFHQFYKNCPVIKAENEEIKNSRIALIKATQIVLKNTLNLLGISAPEKM